ncbi:uncharacterized protein LOC112343229 [Selaginella moellendorffii]|uniref:uncharacterized protein LOC112343229 n=1 Tax=Selaginella moellendorffii TaxID=88036 RepID=UPI000D1C6F83|nr:uncharacterized protein LOC112343229 [Selaginella moellendorffii]|eukprot:XP_024522128.1 uncharacterized protein LOC112343229 [Selaginella moellendorffii]
MDGRAAHSDSKRRGLVLAVLEYASPTTVRPKVDYPLSVKEALQVAWDRPYQDPCKVLDYVAEVINGLFDEWHNDMGQLAAWTMVLQSSGWGKSRTMRELATKGFYVVYVSFLKIGSTGIPDRSAVAQQLINSKMSNDPHAVAAWVLAILTQIKEKSPEEWMKEQSEPHFGEPVAKSYLKLRGEVLEEVRVSKPGPGQDWDGVKRSGRRPTRFSYRIRRSLSAWTRCLHGLDR